jgi:hypothetical protein
MLRLPFQSTPKNHTLGIWLLCAIYLSIQIFYIHYSLLTTDDLWLAYHTFHYKNSIPYHDFAPYKTVLGYYILIIPMLIFKGLFQPLLYTKMWLALINIVFLAGAALSLKKIFPAKAVLVSLALIVFSQTFLNYSAEIRVDILSFWLCLISALFIFENKYLLAGISLGIGFAFCQKAIWYIIATDCALAMQWLCHVRTTKMLRDVTLFNVAAGLVIAGYIGFWSCLSSLSVVLHSIFYDAYIISTTTSYLNIRYDYWAFILTNNPLLFLLSPFILFSFFIVPQHDSHKMKRTFIATYAAIILFFMISCTSPFSYYMLATMPAFFLLYAALFSWLFDLFQQPGNQIRWVGKEGIIGFVVLYLFILLTLKTIFFLPSAYLLTGMIPILVAASVMTKLELRQTGLNLILITTLFVGMVFPLTRFISLLPDLDGHYQRYLFNLTHQLLAENEDYVAGEPLFYNKTQPIPGLEHIILPSLEYLYQPTERLLRIMMLSSLYLSTATSDQIIESIKNADIKLYVNNNRFNFLPPKIKNYLATQYQHYWGSIYLYAPQISAGSQSVKIKFTGKYRVVSHTSVTFNGHKLLPYSVVYLTKNNYHSDARHAYRLQLIPDNMPRLLDTRYQEDSWQSVIG